jgi:hypothetical protein
MPPDPFAVAGNSHGAGYDPRRPLPATVLGEASLQFLNGVFPTPPLRRPRESRNETTFNADKAE